MKINKRRFEMKIKEIPEQYGRGFIAIYSCEYCGHEKSNNITGDINNYIICDVCGNIEEEVII